VSDPEEPAPPRGGWTRAYAIVLGAHLVVIALLALLTWIYR
jgi:hypothetical protein